MYGVFVIEVERRWEGGLCWCWVLGGELEGVACWRGRARDDVRRLLLGRLELVVRDQSGFVVGRCDVQRWWLLWWAE